MKAHESRLFSLLPEIRKGAILLVDAFDWLDSNLCNLALFKTSTF